MLPRATSLIAGLSGWRQLEVSSASLAIGSASVFVAAVALVSLAVDRVEPRPGIAGDNWSLRGTLAPFDQPGPVDGYALPVPSSDGLTGLSFSRR